MAKVRFIINNYEDYKRLRAAGSKKKELKAAQNGKNQLIAWEARYKVERGKK